ncbi:hypothetical protein KM1_011790 [Entamoeba histolytica HM-3:IMSS]|uniref:Uncharacterized protein n=2 Tax=Entamoeba histolytica TaxID=5759 RepID=M2SCG1_ENTHI|nr:Hypothetical protein EHI5A_007570 [Entamoeba histolytica KU27]EMS14639.1 hypothetical protein KM1_011790 [Entamoeba histolytica HM-3:IMSS]
MLLVFLIVIIGAFAQINEKTIQKELIKKVNEGVEMQKIYSDLDLLCKQNNIVKVKKIDIRKALDIEAERVASKIKAKIEKEKRELRKKRIETEMRQLRKDALLVKKLRFENSIERDKEALKLAKKSSPINSSFFKDAMKQTWRLKQKKLGINDKKQ